MNPAQTSSRKILTIVIHLIILGALAFVIYYPVLDKPLNNFDDLKWLEDTKIRNSITTIFDPTLVTKNPFASTYYLPLQSALYWAMGQLFGRLPAAFHGLSIAIHASCTFLLYFILAAFTRKKNDLGKEESRYGLAFLGSLFFVAYLGHTQSVTWTAAAFSHPLVSVFVLATLLFFLNFLRTSKRAYYLGALLSFFTALLIRESAVVVPVLLVALELFYQRKESDFSFAKLKDGLLKKSYKYIPFFLGIVPIALISMRKFQHGSLNERWGGVVSGVYPALRFLDFSSLLVYPARMSLQWKLVLVAILLGIASWIIFNFRKFSHLFFALFWIAVALAPYTISNFNPALAVMRYLYPAMLAFTLLLTVFAFEAISKKPKIVIPVYLIFATLSGVHLFYVMKAMH